MKKEIENKEPIIRHPDADVVIINGEFVIINDHKYRILANFRDALDEQLLMKKFDPYLEKYDFIVGDVSSEKLRLKGFYRSSSDKINLDKRFDFVDDYLAEYLNPGVAYFILESLEPKKQRVLKKHRDFKQKNVKKTDFSNTKVEKKHNAPKRQQGFVIKKRKNSNES